MISVNYRREQMTELFEHDFELDDTTVSAEDPITDKMLERAYMGEHPNIQPAEQPRKPLTLKEQIFYEYIKSHPNYTMPKACRDLIMTQYDYIKIKQRIAHKGYKISGVIETKKANT